jgi:hypothetical protein
VTCTGVSSSYQITLDLTAAPTGTRFLQNTVNGDKVPYQVVFGVPNRTEQSVTLTPGAATATIPLSLLVAPRLFVSAGTYKDNLQFAVSYPSDTTTPTATSRRTAHPLPITRRLPERRLPVRHE